MKIERRLSVESKAIASLIPYARNARTHSAQQVAQIAGSLREFGWTNPVLIDEEGGIIAGHGRVMAATQLGMSEVPTITLSGLSKAQRQAYILLDNQLPLNAGWNEELLALELQDLKELSFDIGLIGFKDSELAKLMGTKAQQQAQSALYTPDRIVQAAFEHFRASGFPYPSLSIHECMQDINDMRAAETESLVNSTLGYAIADTFHRHRFDGYVQGKKSPVDGFKDDKILRRILDFTLEHGRLAANFSAISLMSGVQACANFRPGFAAHLYRRFCEPGAAVLDTSTGYGGRLVGAIGSGVVASYTGIDPNQLTCAANLAMLAALGNPIEMQIIEQPAEDVKLKTLKRAPFDFAFTSPPYFSKEHYSEDATQSFKRYPAGQDWRDGFLAKMLALQFAALKRGAYALVNIEDVKIDGTTYPLVEWARECGIAAGFGFDRIEKFPLPASNWVDQDAERFERVLVFRKP
jgi:hypothetical protein